jgi:hypothetical protein
MAKEESTLSICLPGETGWELWKQGPGGPTLAQTVPLADGGTPASFKHADVLAYPVLASFVLPTLAQTGDEEMIDAVVAMNLEKNGMKGETDVGRLIKTRIVDRSPTQSLAVSAVLHEKVTPQLMEQRPSHYELSPYLYYLPDDSLVLWKELDKLVVCVTKGDSPVYFHALTSSELDDGAIGEIENLLMQLDFQGLASDVRQITLWTDAAPEARQALSNALQLPLKVDKRPPPSYNSAQSTYEPTAVALAKIQEARMRRIRNIVMACVAVYLCVIGGLVALHMMRLKENEALQKTARNLKSVIVDVEPTIDQWRQTEHMRDKDSFMGETLRRIMEVVASRQFQLKLTNIRITSETKAATTDDPNPVASPKRRVEIKGETRNQNICAQYRNFLTTNKETSIYEWTAPAYQPMRGDVHPFTIIGNAKETE